MKREIKFFLIQKSEGNTQNYNRSTNGAMDHNAYGYELKPYNK